MMFFRRRSLLDGFPTVTPPIPSGDIEVMPGMIWLYNPSVDKYLFAYYDELEQMDIDGIADQWTPIGMAVIPASYDMEGEIEGLEKMPKVMSVKLMSWEDPENGGTSDDWGTSIVWGWPHKYAEKVTNLKYFTTLPRLNNPPYTASSGQYNESESVITNGSMEGRLPMTWSFTGTVTTYSNEFDIEPYENMTTFYKTVSGNIASPFTSEGTVNPLYIETDVWSNILGRNILLDNAFTDYSGVANTGAIVGCIDSGDLITGDEAGLETFQAAYTCWKYHTVGTKETEWHLPSLYEIGFLPPRNYLIDAGLQMIKDIYGYETAETLLTSYYWTSTLHSTDHVYICNTEGSVNVSWAPENGMLDRFHARAFHRLTRSELDKSILYKGL